MYFSLCWRKGLICNHHRFPWTQKAKLMYTWYRTVQKGLNTGVSWELYTPDCAVSRVSDPLLQGPQASRWVSPSGRWPGSSFPLGLVSPVKASKLQLAGQTHLLDCGPWRSGSLTPKHQHRHLVETVTLPATQRTEFIRTIAGLTVLPPREKRKARNYLNTTAEDIRPYYTSSTKWNITLLIKLFQLHSLSLFVLNYFRLEALQETCSVDKEL